MSFASQHNQPKIRFDFELTEGHTYTDLRSLAETNSPETIYKVRGMYINTKGLYGDSPVIVTDKHLVNAPLHLTQQVEKIIRNAQSVQQVKDGLVGFKIVEYTNDYGTHYSLEWVDIK